MSLIVATRCVEAAPDAASALEFLDRLGVARAMLVPGLPAGEDLAKRLGRWEGRLFLHHACLEGPAEPIWNLAAGDEDWRRRSVARAQETMRRAAGLGAPFYSLHPGFALEGTLSAAGEPLGSAVPRPRALDRLCRSLDALASLADDLGLDLLLENAAWLPGGPRHGLLAAPDEAEGLLRRLDAPPLGLECDVAHLLLTSRSLGYEPELLAAAFAPRTRAIGLSRSDGRRVTHGAPIEGGVEWGLAEALGAPGKPVVLEAWGLSESRLTDALARAQERWGRLEPPAPGTSTGSERGAIQEG